jgi:3-dehydroquinate synthetase
MEIVLVGAPGCGARSVGRALAERHGARLIDLTGTPERRADVLAGLRGAASGAGPAPDAGPGLRRVVAADRIVADPAVRARLYRGRHVIWLDVPSEQLVERLRAARREDIEVDGSVRTFIADHLAAYHPYYFAGTRVDASGSISDTIDRIGPFLDRPPGAGTLVLRAELHGGLVELGEGILSRSMAHVLERLRARRCVVLTSARSRARADDAAVVVREVAGIPVDVEELPDGEPSKLLEEQEHLYRRLADRQLERRDPLLAIGDDALLEAGTFAAAVWLRGVPLVTVPVTTLGLIDTAIGGKGGIDLSGVGRNLLGSIHQPMATILDVALVEDESAEDRRAALAEAVKYGLIGDDALLSLLETGVHAGNAGPWPRGAELLELVERCALAKRRLVALDEHDTEGIRVALNLGHTMSHALEAATGYRLGHGEAVAYGLRTALELGSTMGVTPGAVAARGVRLLDGLGLGMARLEIPLDEVLGYIEADRSAATAARAGCGRGRRHHDPGRCPGAMVRTAAAGARRPHPRLTHGRAPIPSRAP